jgi:hypothetical protein
MKPAWKLLNSMKIDGEIAKTLSAQIAMNAMLAHFTSTKASRAIATNSALATISAAVVMPDGVASSSQGSSTIAHNAVKAIKARAALRLPKAARSPAFGDNSISS